MNLLIFVFLCLLTSSHAITVNKALTKNLIFEAKDLSLNSECSLTFKESFDSYFTDCLKEHVESYLNIPKEVSGYWTEQNSGVQLDKSELKPVVEDVGELLVPASPYMNSKRYHLSKKMVGLNHLKLSSMKFEDKLTRNLTLYTLCNKINPGPQPRGARSFRQYNLETSRFWCDRAAEVELYLISDIYFSYSLGRYIRAFWMKGYTSSAFWPERYIHNRNSELPVLWSLGKSSIRKKNTSSTGIMDGGDFESNTYEVSKDRFIFFSEIFDTDDVYLDEKYTNPSEGFERICKKQLGDIRRCTFSRN